MLESVFMETKLQACRTFLLKRDFNTGVIFFYKTLVVTASEYVHSKF